LARPSQTPQTDHLDPVSVEGSTRGGIETILAIIEVFSYLLVFSKRRQGSTDSHHDAVQSGL